MLVSVSEHWTAHPISSFLCCPLGQPPALGLSSVITGTDRPGSLEPQLQPRKHRELSTMGRNGK